MWCIYKFHIKSTSQICNNTKSRNNMTYFFHSKNILLIEDIRWNLLLKNQINTNACTTVAFIMSAFSYDTCCTILQNTVEKDKDILTKS